MSRLFGILKNYTKSSQMRSVLPFALTALISNGLGLLSGTYVYEVIRHAGLASVVTFSTTTVLAFGLNKLLVFRESQKNRALRQLSEIALMYLGLFFLNLFVVQYLSAELGVAYVMSQLMSVALCGLLSYSIQSKYIFRSEKVDHPLNPIQ